MLHGLFQYYWSKLDADINEFTDERKYVLRKIHAHLSISKLHSQEKNFIMHALKAPGLGYLLALC